MTTTDAETRTLTHWLTHTTLQLAGTAEPGVWRVVAVCGGWDCAALRTVGGVYRANWLLAWAAGGSTAALLEHAEDA
jgi:hypothetical protein